MSKAVWKTAIMRGTLFLAAHQRAARLLVWLSRIMNGPVR